MKNSKVEKDKKEYLKRYNKDRDFIHRISTREFEYLFSLFGDDITSDLFDPLRKEWMTRTNSIDPKTYRYS